MKISIAPHHADYNVKKDPNLTDYENYELKPDIPDKYIITKSIGKGKYSEVFLGIARSTSPDEQKTAENVVIKVLKPIKIEKIKREVLILKTLDTHPNVICLKNIVFDKQTKLYSLIFSFISHGDAYTIIRNATPKDTFLYSLQLAHGINHCHFHGIMHRDIKPGNLIICTKTKQLKIIDMGLAEFYFPQKEYSVRVASKYYKAPELLLNYPYYAYSLDTWGFGAVLGEMITDRHPFFYTAKKNDDVLEEIVSLLGKKDLRIYLKKYDIVPSEMVRNILDDPDIPETRQDFIPLLKNNDYLPFINILNRCLIYDHQERIPAHEIIEALNKINR